MNLLALKLMAPLTALATMGLIACADSGDGVPDATTTAPVSDTLDPVAAPTPADPIPSAPPEIPAGDGLSPQPLDPADPNAPPPVSPPPVLPEPSPN